MLSIDVTNIKDHSEELKSLIVEYENITMNIALEVNNLNPKGWHDSNSDAFFAEEETQKIEIQKMISNINTICAKYDEIVDLVTAIDSSIKNAYSNPSVQNTVKNRYDTAINKISNLISRIQGCSTYFCTGGERSAINSAKNALSRALDKMKKSSDKVDKLFDKLKDLEIKIKNLLSSMDIRLSNEIDLSKFLNT
jgi:hypothetical protein